MALTQRWPISGQTNASRANFILRTALAALLDVCRCCWPQPRRLLFASLLLVCLCLPMNNKKANNYAGARMGGESGRLAWMGGALLCSGWMAERKKVVEGGGRGSLLLEALQGDVDDCHFPRGRNLFGAFLFFFFVFFLLVPCVLCR